MRTRRNIAARTVVAAVYGGAVVTQNRRQVVASAQRLAAGGNQHRVEVKNARKVQRAGILRAPPASEAAEVHSEHLRGGAQGQPARRRLELSNALWVRTLVQVVFAQRLGRQRSLKASLQRGMLSDNDLLLRIRHVRRGADSVAV